MGIKRCIELEDEDEICINFNELDMYFSIGWEVKLLEGEKIFCMHSTDYIKLRRDIVTVFSDSKVRSKHALEELLSLILLEKF